MPAMLGRDGAQVTVRVVAALDRSRSSMRYRAAAGEHADRSESRAVMVADRRVLTAFTVRKLYGAKIR